MSGSTEDTRTPLAASAFTVSHHPGACEPQARSTFSHRGMNVEKAKSLPVLLRTVMKILGPCGPVTSCRDSSDPSDCTWRTRSYQFGTVSIPISQRSKLARGEVKGTVQRHGLKQAGAGNPKELTLVSSGCCEVA